MLHACGQGVGSATKSPGQCYRIFIEYAIPKINMLRNLMQLENEVKAAVHLISTVQQPEPRFTTA